MSPFLRNVSSSLFINRTIITRNLPQQTRILARSRMASNVGQTISEVAKTEGDNSKGSTAAQMQSNVAKARNAETVESEVGSKVVNDPSSVTSDDASRLHRAEARAEGTQNPPNDLLSKTQSLASSNETGATQRAVNGNGDTMTADQQSKLDRETNYQEIAQKVLSKLGSDPSSITKEDANKMHSREQRAFGQTSSDGLSSASQHQVAENEGKTG